MADRKSHDDVNCRRWVWRSLDLVGPRGRFLRRRGLDLRMFGIYVHDIEQPDPGLDLHDHPWPFVSIILRGAYTEQHGDTRFASALAYLVDQFPVADARFTRTWRRWSAHRIRMTEAHRIISCEPGTRTLVIRGRKTRRWGFYTPTGWVDQTSYDYDARRPCSEVRS